MNNSNLDKQVKAYILDCIDASGYREDEPETPEDKLKFLKDTFYVEYGWNVERIGECNAVREWLQGLPSAIHIAFYNGDILKLAEEWGSLVPGATDSKQQKIIDNWFNLLANKTCQLWRKYKI